MSRTTCCLLLFCFLSPYAGSLWAQESDETPRIRPILKFFYFDERNTEWFVSAEPDRLQSHLDQNEDSANLFESVQASLVQPEEMQRVRSIMSTWINGERDRFDQMSARNARRIRVAEGVTAYMRAHDFEISQLVAALLRRSEAEDVELVAIHLIDRAGNSSYKLKVVLPYDTIQIDKQGFDVVLESSKVTYVSVIYALSLALYEVHEIINAEATDDPIPETAPEELPVPGALPLPGDTTLRPQLSYRE